MIKSLLYELRNSCAQRSIPCISIATEQFLVDYLLAHKPKRCLELGSAVGYSGLLMADLVGQRWGQVTSYEISYPHYKEALYHQAQSTLTNLLLIHADISQISLQSFVFEPYDFVFIDARKAQYGIYLERVWGMLAGKCSLVLDDAIKYANKLSSVYTFFSKNQVFHETLQLEPDDGVILITMKS